MTFNIVIPAYNTAQWILKTIASVKSQMYTDWKAVIINDASTDNTRAKIQEGIQYDSRFHVIDNSVRVISSLSNFVTGINYLDMADDAVIVMLDGDDWLYDEYALAHLDKIYTDANIWLTYGQYQPLSGMYANYCQPLQDTRTYRRDCKWVTSHLKTYRYKLFKHIRDTDLRDGTGGYYKVCSDIILMFPMIELAGLSRIKFVDKVLYMYNDLNELNEMKVRGGEQVRISKFIRSLPLYEELV